MIETIAEIDEIKEVAGKIYSALKPCKIYLFGSFAKGTQKEDSDYDFYVIVDDDVENILAVAQKAQMSIGLQRNRSVDVIADRKSHFDKMKELGCAFQREVYREGVLLYE